MRECKAQTWPNETHLQLRDTMPPRKGAQRKPGPATAMEGQPFPLFQLPETALARILVYLIGKRKRAAFRSVCRRARQLVNQNVTGAQVGVGSLVSHAFQ